MEEIKKTSTRGRKPKSTTTKKVEVENNTSYDELEQENKKLKSEVDAIKEMLSKLMEQKNEEIEKKIEEPIKRKKYDSNLDEVNPNLRIPVISLYNGVLAVSTAQKGEGQPYVFHEFGEVQLIRYGHLIDILGNYIHFAKAGYFYIDNESVIVTHALIDNYEKLLSKEDIDNLLKIDKNEMIKLYERTTNEQRQEILSWFREKSRNGQDLDLNRLAILNKIYDKKNNSDTDIVDHNDYLY